MEVIPAQGFCDKIEQRREERIEYAFKCLREDIGIKARAGMISARNIVL